MLLERVSTYIEGKKWKAFVFSVRMPKYAAKTVTKKRKKENEATKKGTSFFCIVLLKSDLAVGMREAGE